MVSYNMRLVALGLAFLLGGCATTQSHDKMTAEVQTASRLSGFPAAIAELDKTATSDDAKAALLYNLERGELLRLNKQYAESNAAFLKADAQVSRWEESAKLDATKSLGVLGAALISERLTVYEGQDYEKVWLTTRMALNRMAQGDLDNARVDIKRTHEREAIIAEIRSKETEAAEAKAKESGAQSTNKELNGYPIETLNDPEVLKLKNGYQNALSHYLSGFVYEVLNESGLAAPGYRKAIELRPDMPLLEEGLRGLDNRSAFTHKRRQQMTDVLFVIEANTAPPRKSQSFNIVLPINGSARAVGLSYPVIPVDRYVPLSAISTAGKTIKLEKIVDLDTMARRALRDAMPGMVIRGVTRAITKAVVQDQLEKRGGLFGAVLSLAASAIVAPADDRIWRMLPGQVYVARGYLPPGVHKLSVDGREIADEIKVAGQYTFVPLRLYENNYIHGEVTSYGVLLPPAVEKKEPVKAQPVAPNKVPLKKPVPPKKPVTVVPKP